MSAGEILLLGDVNIDSFWPVPEFPVPGRDGLVDEVRFEIGGAVFNTAIFLDRLGVSTRLLSCIGKDLWADSILDALKETKIQTSSIQIKPEAMTGINFTIVTTDGERTMFTHRGANAHYEPSSLKETDFENAALLHISGYALLTAPQKDSVWRSMEIAKQYGVPISLDSGLEPVIKRTEDFRRLFKELTICISGLEEAAQLFGCRTPQEAAERFMEEGVKLAAIKLGSEGSLLATKEKSIFMPCFMVETIDTTGAGDSFSAGVIYGWQQGFELLETATLASTLGALATTVYGAGFSLPRKETIIEFLKKGKHPNVDFMEKSVAFLIENLLTTDEH
ncbi:MAG: carbohydrate kinase family protein [Chloroflexi bacterium]|nr:carbohydrate kinase family protein [Chloroflexota bacterium]